jgi:hypothetical protein
MQRPSHAKIDVAAKMVHGEKPEWTDEEVLITDSKVYTAINWYNYHHNKSDAKKFLIAYYKHTDNKDMVKLARKFDELHILNSVGWVCDMIVNGANIVDESGIFLNRIADMEKHPEKYLAPKSTISDEKVDKRTKSPQERMKPFVLSYCATIDQSIDTFLQNGCKETADFSMYDFLNTLKTSYYSSVVDIFDPLVIELRAVLEGKDKDLKESYSFLTKPQLKRYLKYIESIKVHSEKIKSKRKSEKKKTKPVKRKTKKVVKVVKKVGKITTKKKPSTDGLEGFLS